MVTALQNHLDVTEEKLLEATVQQERSNSGSKNKRDALPEADNSDDDERDRQLYRANGHDSEERSFIQECANRSKSLRMARKKLYHHSAQVM